MLSHFKIERSAWIENLNENFITKIIINSTAGLGKGIDLVGYLIKNGSPLQKGAELAQFIAERAELIKVPEDQGGFDFSPAISKNYFISQNEIANSFCTMTKLEPYLKQSIGIL